MAPDTDLIPSVLFICMFNGGGNLQVSTPEAYLNTPDFHGSTGSGSTPTPADLEYCHRSIDEKALVRKIDRRLIPILFIIYVAAFLNLRVTTQPQSEKDIVLSFKRVDIVNALTMHFPTRYRACGYAANLVLTIFFVP